MSVKYKHLTALLAVLSQASGISMAQGLIDEIVVTATKQDRSLQDIPVAVSVLPAETVQAAQIQDVIDLQSIVPSLRVTQLQTSTQTNFIIRGFGNGANNPGIESSVGVFIDGVYRSRSASQIDDYLDIERIEVLRGPQSTLFGQNASSGVINIVTRKPEQDFAGMLQATAGNFNTQRLRGQITGPLNDSTAFSLAGSLNKSDGYFNDIGNDAEINDRDRWSLRAQLQSDPTDNFSVRIIGDTSRIDEACCGVVNVFNGPTSALVRAIGGDIHTDSSSDRKAYLNKPPSNIVENEGLSLHLDWLVNGLAIQSISAFRHQHAEFDYDSDFTSADLVASNLNVQDIDTFTQEFRLGQNGESFSWLLGAYYIDEVVDYDSLINYGQSMRPYIAAGISANTGNAAVLDTLESLLGLPAGSFFAAGQGSSVSSTQDMESYTFFGQADFDLGERFTLTIGGAYSDNRKDINLAAVNSDVFAGLDFVEIGFAQAFSTLTGGLAPIPQNLAAYPLQAATSDFISVTPCSASNLPPACNAALDLYELQYLTPVSPAVGNSGDTEATYTLKLTYDLTDNIRVYGGISTGYKATSWNLSRDSKPLAPATADRSPLGNYPNPYYGRYGTRYAGPEESTVMELGFKGEWSNSRFYLTLFDQEIKGFQSNIFTGTGFSLANSGMQSTQGVEFEWMWLPDENWEINFSGTLMDPLYDSFTGAAGPDGPADLSGTRPAGIHRRSLSAGLMYRWEIGSYAAFARADYQYESKVAVVDNIVESLASREVGVLNASLGLTRNDWNLLFWGRNLNDDSYLLSAFPSVAQPGSLSGYLNAPRTWGATITRNF